MCVTSYQVLLDTVHQIERLWDDSSPLPAANCVSSLGSCAFFWELNEKSLLLAIQAKKTFFPDVGIWSIKTALERSTVWYSSIYPWTLTHKYVKEKLASFQTFTGANSHSLYLSIIFDLCYFVLGHRIKSILFSVKSSQHLVLWKRLLRHITLFSLKMLPKPLFSMGLGT